MIHWLDRDGMPSAWGTDAAGATCGRLVATWGKGQKIWPNARYEDPGSSGGSNTSGL